MIALVHFLLSRTDKTKALKVSCMWRLGSLVGWLGCLVGWCGGQHGGIEEVLLRKFESMGCRIVAEGPSRGLVASLPHCLSLHLSLTCLLAALQDAFYRQGLPNIMQLLATVSIFLMVVYFQVSVCVCVGACVCMCL